MTSEKLKNKAQEFLDEVSPGKEFGVQAELVKSHMRVHVVEYMARFADLCQSDNLKRIAELEADLSTIKYLLKGIDGNFYVGLNTRVSGITITNTGKGIIITSK